MAQPPIFAWLIVDMRYDLGRVYIRHVLTHAEYDRRKQTGTL